MIIERKMVGRDKYGYPIDQWGQRIMKTSRPDTIPVEVWNKLSAKDKDKLRKTHREMLEKSRAASRIPPPNVQHGGSSSSAAGGAVLPHSFELGEAGKMLCCILST